MYFVPTDTCVSKNQAKIQLFSRTRAFYKGVFCIIFAQKMKKPPGFSRIAGGLYAKLF